MKFSKIINIFLIVFFIAFGILLSANKFKENQLTNNNKLQIYELWHIESFEGGGANRENYLKSIALNYEKNNPTSLFMIRNIDYVELENNLKQHTPHLISFSEQVATTVLPYLLPFEKEYNVKQNFIDSATFNSNLMAIPFIASGYCYFTKTPTNSKLNIYTANNNKHSAISIIQGENINNNQTLSSYECYAKFVNSNNIKLLGTARDLFRIKNLESLGKFAVEYEPLSSFSDLIQYIGITTNDLEVLSFVKFLMSDINQRQLVNLGLFSTTLFNIYTEDTYSLMEQALNTCHVPNIFNS